MTRESMQLEDYLRDLNRDRTHLNRLLRVVRIVQSLILALIFYLLWAWLQPEAWLQQLLVFLLSAASFYVVDTPVHFRNCVEKCWILALEMRYPDAKKSALTLLPGQKIADDWQDLIEAELAQQRLEDRRLIGFKTRAMALPFLCLASLFFLTEKPWEQGLSSLQRIFMSFSYGAHLRVVDGAVKEGPAEFKLRGQTLELIVLEQNLIEVSVKAPPETIPTLQLNNTKGQPIQSFQLNRDENSQRGDAVGTFFVTFSLDEDADLVLSTISSSTPTARIKVKTLPVPQVRLTNLVPSEQLWPDDRPVPLQIVVTAEHPLRSVHLIMKSGERSRRELVSDVLAQDKRQLQTTYNLSLEAFMEQDIEDIEIIAEAQDRALPMPLTGRSPPLIIKVASAYGRYRETLRSLSAAKSELDAGLQATKDFNSQGLKELGDKIANQAEDSPFFDAIDRQQIQQLQANLASIQKSRSFELMLQTSEDLNRFLFEHESLDDRERDRDFFIAARTLSRLLEQTPKERAVSVQKVTDRMNEFLDERHKRWELRVGRLDPTHRPSQWPEIQGHPFQKAIEKIQRLDAQSPPALEAALQSLSHTVESYQQWIEALESKEDTFRQQQEQKRQQDLANAQEQIRELQKRQGLISGKLDKAPTRSHEQLAESWAAVRLEQNSNIKGARELEGQMRSMSQNAAQRMKVAVDAMEATVEQGNGQKFIEAESSSDLAGRLLSQAESAAKQSQQQQNKRGRRRRVTSDQYYGSQVAGGDVDMNRNYQVNRRYREDVLNDIRSLHKTENGEGAGPILEEYLRKVIR